MDDTRLVVRVLAWAFDTTTRMILWALNRVDPPPHEQPARRMR